MNVVTPRCLFLFLSALLTGGAYCQPDQHWPLDSPLPAELKTIGGVNRECEGIEGGRGLVFSGFSVVRVADSADLTEDPKGFTFTIWVNPYKVGGVQQMIASKHIYALNQRQWGVMIDLDGLFRLYTWQGEWHTTESAGRPIAGHWYHLGVRVTAQEADLWINGAKVGSIVLKRPLKGTDAPLTFGGSDDDGGMWQNFVGALDEARLVPRILPDKKMSSLYRPQKPHKVPPFPESHALWANSKAIPKAADLPVLKGVRHQVIKPYEFQNDGYRFLHGVALAHHRGRLFASFGHNKGGENTASEEARVCQSADLGVTWSKITTIDSGHEPDLGVSHGVFHKHQGQLWAFHGAYTGTMKDVHTRAYLLDNDTGGWDAKGTIISGGFWPMQEPVKMDDGNWIMSGLRVGKGNPSAVAISHGTDFTKWDLVVIKPTSDVKSMWGESTVMVQGEEVFNIARFGSASHALMAFSNDFGRSWTTSSVTNLPMATSKPYTGKLSTGQHYLICTTTADSGKRRSPLTIALSRPGETDFRKVFVIRPALFPAGPGESHKNAQLAYPYAVEHDGHLYVGFSNNGGNVGRVGKGRELWNNNSAELAVIPVKSLQVE